MNEAEENALWDDWDTHYLETGRDPKRISRDGALSLTHFNQAPVRVLFALKEVNGVGGWSLINYLQGGPEGKGSMWHSVARWAAGIQQDFPSYSEINTPASKKSALQRSAIVNLKKPGGTAQADMSIVNAYALLDRALLARQIRSLAPHIVIACGTFDSLAWLLDLQVNPDNPSLPVKDTDGGFWVIPWRHPGRASGRGTYDGLCKRLASIPKTDNPTG